MKFKADNRPIAFLDSGVGGVSVLREAQLRYPNENYIYFADSKNAPYGTKSAQEVHTLVLHAVDFLSQFDPKALVVACNTATSTSIAALRDQYSFSIVGMEPAIKPALKQLDTGKIAVLGTKATLQGQKLKDLIDQTGHHDKIEFLDLTYLVEYAEQFNFLDQDLLDSVKNSFLPFDWSLFASVVLGCTHFNYFVPLFKRVLPSHIEYLDGNKGTVNRLFTLIKNHDSSRAASLKCFLSMVEVSPELLRPFIDFLDNTSFTSSLTDPSKD